MTPIAFQRLAPRALTSRPFTPDSAALLKTIEAKRRELDHYNRKMDELKNKKEKAKKETNSSQQKFMRNEQKQQVAQAAYDGEVDKFVGVVSEIVDEGWKDLQVGKPWVFHVFYASAADT